MKIRTCINYANWNKNTLLIIKKEKHPVLIMKIKVKIQY